MTYYELFQLEKYGDILPPTPVGEEEFEYLNIENREACEWTKKQVENETN